MYLLNLGLHNILCFIRYTNNTGVYLTQFLCLTTHIKLYLRNYSKLYILLKLRIK